jgi:hypothetical protein
MTILGFIMIERFFTVHEYICLFPVKYFSTLQESTRTGFPIPVGQVRKRTGCSATGSLFSPSKQGAFSCSHHAHSPFFSTLFFGANRSKRRPFWTGSL